MARPKNPNTPTDGRTLATTVSESTAKKVRIRALLAGQTVSDWIRTIVEANTQGEVQVTVDGEPVDLGEVA